ncbi:truncated transcription factor CAULIFLOWER A-like isoform X4 [Citrus sinensis]|uniref:truncated transcription factor CAULIFLOWER A isoform X2 n=1 Tax=Citrus clementina TaxID=85681 RepID=UPI000CECEA58|nr:truncated transcription factor CAULIFLOWER A isoform X2 [Citrus x clementina]XP_024949192.1 truncated transcription factor CAULIFLOWER A-like isoform X4 [Citrus sinensis]
MGRGKVELKRIENKTNRQVTFSKRKNGILKKAFELSVLCDAEIALVIFSPSGKAYHYASDHHTMDKIIARYRREVGQLNSADQRSRLVQLWKSEIEKLERSVETMEARLRHLTGEDLSSLSIKDLKKLERQLKIGVERIRSKKKRLIAERINELKTRQKELQEESSRLKKIMYDEMAPTEAEEQCLWCIPTN